MWQAPGFLQHVAHRRLLDFLCRCGRALLARLLRSYCWRRRAEEGCWMAGCIWSAALQRRRAVRWNGYCGMSLHFPLTHGAKSGLTPPGLPLRQRHDLFLRRRLAPR